eukprot:7264212-Pyramimonas_sp.AAC.1
MHSDITRMSRWLDNCEETRTTMDTVNACVTVASNMAFKDDMPGVLGNDGNKNQLLKNVFDAMKCLKELGVASRMALRNMIDEGTCVAFHRWYDDLSQQLALKLDCHVAEVAEK